MTVWRKLLIAALVLIVALPLALGISGYFLYTKASEDPLTPADAIVVLGGEHDGRIEYGLTLAQQGIAHTVLLSNPYSGYNEKPMRQYCDAPPRSDGIEIICFAPDPSTTQGEARFSAQMAKERGWHKLLVITWRFHLPRAHYIFTRCFSGQIEMRSVPRQYNYGIAQWEFTYLYQTFGFAKAAVLGC